MQLSDEIIHEDYEGELESIRNSRVFQSRPLASSAQLSSKRTSKSNYDRITPTSNSSEAQGNIYY